MSSFKHDCHDPGVHPERFFSSNWECLKKSAQILTEIYFENLSIFRRNKKVRPDSGRNMKNIFWNFENFYIFVRNFERNKKVRQDSEKFDVLKQNLIFFCQNLSGFFILPDNERIMLHLISILSVQVRYVGIPIPGYAPAMIHKVKK